uniref:Uncharacterized protein n=1 Tax=Panagrellus redivivus TaxID=6233 RepID=A0A7E4V896_PANRE
MAVARRRIPQKTNIIEKKEKKQQMKMEVDIVSRLTEGSDCCVCCRWTTLAHSAKPVPLWAMGAACLAILGALADDAAQLLPASLPFTPQNHGKTKNDERQKETTLGLILPPDSATRGPSFSKSHQGGWGQFLKN